MPSVNRSIEIPAAPEAVWAKLADFGSHSEWNTIHTGYPDGGPAALEPAATFREQVTLMGMPAEVAWTIADVEPQKRIALDGDGPMGVKLRRVFEIEPAGDGTRVSFENDFEATALGPMLDTLLAQAGKALDDSLAKLRQSLA